MTLSRLRAVTGVFDYLRRSLSLLLYGRRTGERFPPRTLSMHDTHRSSSAPRYSADLDRLDLAGLGRQPFAFLAVDASPGLRYHSPGRQYVFATFSMSTKHAHSAFFCGLICQPATFQTPSTLLPLTTIGAVPHLAPLPEHCVTPNQMFQIPRSLSCRVLYGKTLADPTRVIESSGLPLVVSKSLCALRCLFTDFVQLALN